ncbi:glycosyltransferase family 2 protein [Siccirubricoccus sp. G192]|uniref:glycosyltransferase family 2 protein n=1 Tax=Siccirubricoccus sp. G192 TaxID=2849651 RepID=UPI001C2C3BFF|nr:glycosyltransferase family 2 protein [Siccirubricoccus sp. G192]MBV1799892.1 glycosyltransferase family 2 protein [Siccirubricoccus sp. G192]
MSLGTPRLSALVVARNEAARLPACLDSLAAADELVVVLDRSGDASAKIARQHGARLLEGAWELEGARRNAGIAACTGDWILEVDADERVPPALWAAIRQVIAASPHGFHRVRIDNYVGERLILHGWGGSFGTTLKPVLFRRGAKHWRAQRVHPGLDWTGTEGERITLAGIRHEVDRDISDMLRRLDRYSSAKATDLLAAGRIGSLPDNLRRCVSRFLKCYFGRRGWKEGGWGLLIALCAGLFPLLAHLKARLEPERHRPSGPVA